MDRVSRSPNPLSFHLIVPMYVVVCTRGTYRHLDLLASLAPQLLASRAPPLSSGSSRTDHDDLFDVLVLVWHDTMMGRLTQCI